MNGDKKKDPMFLVLGAVLSLFGICLIFARDYTSWKYGYLDFGPYHALIGIALLALGVITIYSALERDR